MKTTKEELVELIGMAELLEAKLKEMGKPTAAADAEYIAWSLRKDLDELCGEEYLETLRDPNKEYRNLR